MENNNTNTIRNNEEQMRKPKRKTDDCFERVTKEESNIRMSLWESILSPHLSPHSTNRERKRKSNKESEKTWEKELTILWLETKKERKRGR